MRRLGPVLLGALLACGSPAWRVAAGEGTARAYERFATEHPDDPKAPAAMHRAEQLRWEAAEERDTAAAWSAYLRIHGASRRADEARRRLDDRAYQEALGDKDALALERYIAAFPEGAHRAEAREHLDAVRWHQAKTEDTHIAYRRYLLQEPDGANADKAARRYEERVWERAARLDTLRALRQYLDEFPDGAHGEEARARIGELTFDRVEIVLALGRSWQSDRAAALRRIASQADALDDKLRAHGFEVVGPVRTVDLGPEGDPSRAAGSTPGVGTVLVRIEDERGEPFEPSGYGTVMTGAVEVYVPARAAPMASWPVSGRTGGRIFAADQSGLYTNAAEHLLGDAWGQLGRVSAFLPRED